MSATSRACRACLATSSSARSPHWSAGGLLRCSAARPSVCVGVVLRSPRARHARPVADRHPPREDVTTTLRGKPLPPRNLSLLGPFHGAIAVPSVTRCRCRRRSRRRGHRCAGGVRRDSSDTWRMVMRLAAARCGEWAQHFSNASCNIRIDPTPPPPPASKRLTFAAVSQHGADGRGFGGGGGGGGSLLVGGGRRGDVAVRVRRLAVRPRLRAVVLLGAGGRL